MGSAVVKPLTRRRGKVKPNEPVNSANGNKEEHAGNSEPTVNPVVDPLADPCSELCKADAKLVRVEADSNQASKQVRCTHFIHIRRGKLPCNNDEEPNLIPIARNKRRNLLKLKKSPKKGKDTSITAESTQVSNLSSTCTNLLPQALDDKNVPIASPNENANILGNTNPEQKPTETIQCQLPEMDSKASATGLHELTPDLVVEDQDASRDARTPSPEYDDLEDVKVINPSPHEHTTSSPTDCDATTPDSKNPLCSGDVGVSISKTDHPAPERKGEHRTEVGHIIFIQPSPSKENNADLEPHRLQGEKSIHVTSSGNNISQILTSPGKTKSEEGFCEQRKKSPVENRCLSERDKYINAGGNASISIKQVKAERKGRGDVCPVCKENNTTGLPDSFGDVADEIDTVSGRSSAASVHGRKVKRPSGDVSENLSLNSPQVEEILAKGEEFMGELDERFVRRHHQKLAENLQDESPRSPGQGDLEGKGEQGAARPCSNNCSRSNSEISADLSGVKLPKIGGSGTSVTARGDKTPSAANSRPTSGRILRSPANGSVPQADSLQAGSRPSSAGSSRPHSRPSSAKICAGQQCKPDTLAPTSAISQTNSKNSSSHSLAKNSSNVKQPSSKASSVHSLKSSNRTSTPQAGNETIANEGTPSRISSRPSSAKQDPHVTESNPARSRPPSGKPSATASVPSNLNSRPQSSHSRRSLTAASPRSGLDMLSQLDVDQCTEGSGDKRTDSPRSKHSQTSLGSDKHRTTLQGDGEYTSHNAKLSGSAEQQPSALASGTVRSATKVGSSRNSPIAVEEKSNRSLTDISNNFNCASPRDCPAGESKQPSDGTASPTDMLCSPPMSSTSARVSSGPRENDASGEDNRCSSARGTGDSAQACWSDKSKGNTAREASGSDRGVESPSPFLNQPKTLSQDQIGSIRKQLYEEGLKPAERDGGVAFFIPVTGDGLQPQVNNTTLTERLTKSRRSSLKYEERMFLANINRQVQLSKKKEFAVRDLRNVKGAISSDQAGSSSCGEKNKVEEVDSDFDSSF